MTTGTASPSVSVERASSPAECAAVRGLVEAHARHEKSPTVVPLDWGIRLSDLIAAGRLALFVAKINGERVGYATMTHDVSTWTGLGYAHLDCLYVAEGHRDAGIGVALIDAISEHARRLGFCELQWQTPTWNAGAIRFYTRLGATRQSKERFALSLR